MVILGTLIVQLGVYDGVRAEQRRVVCLVHSVGDIAHIDSKSSHRERGGSRARN